MSSLESATAVRSLPATAAVQTRRQLHSADDRTAVKNNSGRDHCDFTRGLSSLMNHRLSESVLKSLNLTGFLNGVNLSVFHYFELWDVRK
jgi:hypothetical protein